MSPLLFKRLSDESLGSRLAAGDAAAFDELYRRYVNRLAAYGSHLLGDAASGDDVAQATMLKAYAALREGRVPEKMKPWLFRIAHNTAIDLVVRRRELPAGDLPDAPSIDREPFAGALVEALATLPDRQRRVYALREVHGLRIDETAAELGLNTSQVEQALFAARNRLAEQLVFGDRLNCVTVQRLAAGPLDGPERRALKTHLRSCTECRQSLGLRGRALSLFPSATGLEWLRGLAGGLIGGGAPAAAKVGAVFATATIAAGVPVAVHHTQQHAHRPVLRVVRPAAAPPTASPVTRSSTPVNIVSVSATHPAAVSAKHESSSRRADAGADDPSGLAGTNSKSGSEDSASKEDGSSGGSGPGKAHSGDSRDGGSSHDDGGTSGDSHDHGSDGGEHDGSHRGSSTTQTSTTQSSTTAFESQTFEAQSDTSHSGDGSQSGDGSGGGDGSGSGGGDGSGGGHDSGSGDGGSSGGGDHGSGDSPVPSVPAAPPLPVTVTTSG